MFYLYIVYIVFVSLFHYLYLIVLGLSYIYYCFRSIFLCPFFPIKLFVFILLGSNLCDLVHETIIYRNTAYVYAYLYEYEKTYTLFYTQGRKVKIRKRYGVYIAEQTSLEYTASISHKKQQVMESSKDPINRENVS